MTRAVRIFGGRAPLGDDAPWSRAGGDALAQRAALMTVFGLLSLFVVAPVAVLLARSVTDDRGSWAGLDNFVRYASSGRFLASLGNTLLVAACASASAVSAALIYAFALTHTRMPLRRLFRAVALVPLFAPSMLFAIGLVYLFGNQGLLTHGGFGRLPFRVRLDLYGPLGIIMSEALAVFPAALLILLSSLGGADGRLYEAAASMGASRVRTFAAVTLPACRYGLVSAVSATAILVMTDFGAPKIVGGRTSVLAVDVYQQVVGQQNLSAGAAVSVLLLLPAAIGCAADGLVRRKRSAALSGRSTRYGPPPNRGRDAAALAFCAVVAGVILTVTAAPMLVSIVDRWPYSLTEPAATGGVFTLRHFALGGAAAGTGGGAAAYFNSLAMAACTAVAGAAVTFVAAYAVEKLRPMPLARRAASFAAVLPLALPGLSLGLAYVLLFGRGAWGGVPSPVAFLYGTVALLVACNVAHFFGVGFLTATAALRRLDPEFEEASASLGVPAHRLFLGVTLPACAPAVLETATYYFVSAMTTVSAVIFLYPPDFPLAAVSVIHLDEAGLTQSAAATCGLILLTNLAARVLLEAAGAVLNLRTRRLTAAATG